MKLFILVTRLENGKGVIVPINDIEYVLELNSHTNVHIKSKGLYFKIRESAREVYSKIEKIQKEYQYVEVGSLVNEKN